MDHSLFSMNKGLIKHQQRNYQINIKVNVTWQGIINVAFAVYWPKFKGPHKSTPHIKKDVLI